MMSSPSTLQTELEGLPPDLIEDALRHACWRAAELRRREEWKALISTGSEAEIIEAAQEYSGGHAVALAKAYRRVDVWQEIVAWADHLSPRRPVFMKGAKDCLIKAYGNSSHFSANGLAESVLKRWLRLKKVTAFTWSEFDEAVGGVVGQLHKRYHLTHHFGKGIAYPPGTGPYSPLHAGERALAYIGGKPAFLSASERSNLQALHKIITKTQKLEDRVSAAKLHWRERMAA